MMVDATPSLVWSSSNHAIHIWSACSRVASGPMSGRVTDSPSGKNMINTSRYPPNVVSLSGTSSSAVCDGTSGWSSAATSIALCEGDRDREPPGAGMRLSDMNLDTSEYEMNVNPGLKDYVRQ